MGKYWFNDLSDEELENVINSTWNLIQDYHEKYGLTCHIGTLRTKKGKYLQPALALICLARDYPNTHIVTVDELRDFYTRCTEKKSDMQISRHLSTQLGWNIQNGTNNTSQGLKRGEFKLISLESTLPDFKKDRRKTFYTKKSFEDIKEKYDNKCACCGSEEGKPHRYWKSAITKLEMGHMDPTKNLSGNIIPQCQFCNRQSKGKWIFDENGRVNGIAPTEDGLNEIKKTIKCLPDKYKEEIRNCLGERAQRKNTFLQFVKKIWAKLRNV